MKGELNHFGFGIHGFGLGIFIDNESLFVKNWAFLWWVLKEGG
jgi:hypothetical protein